MRKLAADEIEQVASAFLFEGWRQQKYELREVSVDPSSIRASVNIIDFLIAKNDDGKFYLSSTVTAPLVAQLGIIHALSSLGEKKEFPVWSREFHLENHRRVRHADGIKLAMTCYEQFQSQNPDGSGPPGMRSNYRYRFDIEDGAFTGLLWLVFRRPVRP